MVRALALHQCGPGFDSGPMSVWVEFVIGSLASRVFSGYSSKTNIYKFQFEHNIRRVGKPAKAEV